MTEDEVEKSSSSFGVDLELGEVKSGGRLDMLF